STGIEEGQGLRVEGRELESEGRLRGLFAFDAVQQNNNRNWESTMHHRRLAVHPLPSLVEASVLAGSTVVVIDLLRATSTICQALASGATEVVPFLEVDEALAAAAKAPDREKIVLGGERGGRRIAGFDLGNSPTEYTPAAVGGK